MTDHYSCTRCGRNPGRSTPPCSSCLDYDPELLPLFKNNPKLLTSHSPEVKTMELVIPNIEEGHTVSRFLEGTGAAPVRTGSITPVKSDGGSSAYYEITVTNKHGETFQCETGDIIRALVNNDFTLGNIVKACRRVSEAEQGRGKEGTSTSYDLNKIIYFAEDKKTALKNQGIK